MHWCCRRRHPRRQPFLNPLPRLEDGFTPWTECTSTLIRQHAGRNANTATMTAAPSPAHARTATSIHCTECGNCTCLIETAMRYQTITRPAIKSCAYRAVSNPSKMTTQRYEM